MKGWQDPLNLPVRLPSKLPLAKRGTHPVPTAGAVVGPSYVISSTKFGTLAIPNSKTRSKKVVFHSDQVIYDAVYSMDINRNRWVPPAQGQDQLNAAQLLFLGCSIVFGEGVGDSETLPARAQAYAPGFRAVNFALPGWGPANIALATGSDEYGYRAPQDSRNRKKNQAVYVYIDDHMRRLVAPLSMYRGGSRWMYVIPYYDVDSRGRLIEPTPGVMIPQGQPVRHFLLTWLSKSEFLRWMNFEWPTRYGDHEFERMAAVLAKIQENIRARGFENLTVAFYPGSNSQYLVPYLNSRGIRTLDYSKVDLADFVSGPVTLRDGHPSPGTHDFLAKQIVNDLDLTH
ncbi:MAG: hypothetical protein JNL01_00515 [Bdellovibrionales bacterium]|nr:hypothetical protein [Bdellovibrionales bacterium]